MRAIIVDDEKKACSNLAKMLTEYIDSSIEIVGTANSTAEAEILIKASQPDVVFLDIEMPEENAFHFLERISPVPFEIVFVTAYDEFALKAFRLNAVDYILKPIRLNYLKNTVDRLQERLQYQAFIAASTYSELSQQVNRNGQPHIITLKGAEGVEIIAFNDIYYAEANGSYSKFVYYKGGIVKEIVSSYALSYYEELLPMQTFFRIHRSFLLNCNYVKSVLNDSCSIEIGLTEIVLPVSRRRAAVLLEFLKKMK
jgi:two-component system LytT family response regulator